MLYLLALVRGLVIALPIVICGVLYDQYTTRRYRRMTEKMQKATNEAIANAFAPIRDLDQRQW